MATRCNPSPSLFKKPLLRKPLSNRTTLPNSPILHSHCQIAHLEHELACVNQQILQTKREIAIKDREC